jgi:hypothetical protein
VISLIEGTRQPYPRLNRDQRPLPGCLLIHRDSRLPLPA